MPVRESSPETLALTLGECLAVYRKRKGFTQTEVARQVAADWGIPLNGSMVSRYEKYGSDDPDARRPQLFHLLAIALVLRVSLIELGVEPEDWAGLDLLLSDDARRLVVDVKDAATRVTLNSYPQLSTALRPPVVRFHPPRLSPRSMSPWRVCPVQMN